MTAYIYHVLTDKKEPLPSGTVILFGKGHGVLHVSGDGKSIEVMALHGPLAIKPVSENIITVEAYKE